MWCEWEQAGYLATLNILGEAGECEGCDDSCALTISSFSGDIAFPGGLAPPCSRLSTV